MWAYDFVHGRTHDDRPLRMLVMVDEETGPGETCEHADFDCNGVVASGDFGYLLGAWSTDCEDLDAADYPPCKASDGPILCPYPRAAIRELADHATARLW